MQSSAMSFASTLLGLSRNKKARIEKRSPQCLSFVSQIATSRKSCKSAQNRALEIILATSDGALKRDDTEIVSFCLDTCADMYIANQSPTWCFWHYG